MNWFRRLKRRIFYPFDLVEWDVRKYYRLDPNTKWGAWRRRCIARRLVAKYFILLGEQSKAGEGLRLPHPWNIAIGDKAFIGRNCILYQDIMIGQSKGIYPTIGDNVILYPGVKVVGNVKLGNHVIVGAGSVVTHSFGDNCIIAGIPAKLIKMREPSDKYF